MRDADRNELLDIVDLGKVTELTKGWAIPVFLEGGTVAPFLYMQI